MIYIYIYIYIAECLNPSSNSLIFCLYQYATCLTGGSFDEARMLQNIEACEWLTGALSGLEPPTLDPSFAKIRAVYSFLFLPI